ncbi:MAG: hypothetical protein IJQ74_01825 [Synergistaceae bacterium]|nr:hypothetical protein [Synergistaceae bacterium]MBQ7267481.1 hypothetical protein [Synergistaceae bacterium]
MEEVVVIAPTGFIVMDTAVINAGGAVTGFSEVVALTALAEIMNTRTSAYTQNKNPLGTKPGG